MGNVDADSDLDLRGAPVLPLEVREKTVEDSIDIMRQDKVPAGKAEG